MQNKIKTVADVEGVREIDERESLIKQNRANDYK